jgi:hypothetical protein
MTGRERPASGDFREGEVFEQAPIPRRAATAGTKEHLTLRTPRLEPRLTQQDFAVKAYRGYLSLAYEMSGSSWPKRCCGFKRIPYVIDNQTFRLRDILVHLLAGHSGNSLDVATAHFNV